MKNGLNSCRRRVRADLTNFNVQESLKKWAEVTALSLRLLEASLQKEFPELSSQELRVKMIERLNIARQAKLPTE